MILGAAKWRHPNTPKRDPLKDERYTPRDYITAWNREFDFTVDAASVAEAPSSQVIGRYWAAAEDGLAQDWGGERVFCNPPFSALPAWVEKAATGGADLVVMLLPANRTDQAWWHEWIECFRDGPGGPVTRFLRSRTPFGGPGYPDAPKRGTPFGCVLVIWRRG